MSIIRQNLYPCIGVQASMTRLVELVTDVGNWELGDLDQTNPFAPVWQPGTFNADK